jgi:hypothetical protein
MGKCRLKYFGSTRGLNSSSFLNVPNTEFNKSWYRPNLFANFSFSLFYLLSIELEKESRGWLPFRVREENNDW